MAQRDDRVLGELRIIHAAGQHHFMDAIDGLGRNPGNVAAFAGIELRRRLGQHGLAILIFLDLGSSRRIVSTAWAALSVMGKPSGPSVLP